MVVVAGVIQVLWALIAAPLLVGVMRQTRARLEGRVGAGIGQPWRDVRKLLRKEPMRAPGSDVILMAAPLVLMVSSLVLTALIPLVTTQTWRYVPGDLFVVVSLLLIGTVAVAMLGLESGSAFGGMGSSRAMTIAALVEPTVLLAVYALSIPAGSSALGEIIKQRFAEPVSAVSLLALVALVIAVIAETGRIPVDNPSTHLELTMVHEAMVLESGGRDLGWIEWGSWLRLTVLVGLVVNLAVPWEIATTLSWAALGLGLLAITLKVLVVVIIIATAEVFAAKIRLFRVPELLAASFVLAFLAVTSSFLVN